MKGESADSEEGWDIVTLFKNKAGGMKGTTEMQVFNVENNRLMKCSCAFAGDTGLALLANPWSA